MTFLIKKLFVLILVLLPIASAAQTEDAAILVADEVLITKDNRLVAKGNVEAYYEGKRMFTDEIIYDQDADTLIIPGPIRLSESNGDVILADSADLDSKMENGILMGARYVLNQELQILSARTDRVEGDLTVLRKVVATSCQICGNGAPIWQIRAKRAIHDRVEKQIYFQNAQFRLLGVPVLYLPRMRLPDPSLERATGFLVPKYVLNTQLGIGLKVPYFFKLGDHADLTLTPFYAQKTRTVELRFRKMFRRGYVQLDGAVTRDELLPGETRAYVTGYGTFDLGRSFTLDFDIEATTDSGYMSQYSYSGKDRLGSAISLSRVKRDSFFNVKFLNYETLRDNEDNDTQPTFVGDFTYERRFRYSPTGGEFRMGAYIHGHKRVSLTDIEGRDMGRASVDLSWRREWTLQHGLRFGLLATTAIDSQTVSQDSTAAARTTTVTPAFAATLRWPLMQRMSGGATHLIEPIAQIGWAGGSPSTLPNDESVSSEFDEGNLLSLSRFPALDRRETGYVGVLGARWVRDDPKGWSSSIALGQVFREKTDANFTFSSGLSELRSDVLIAGSFSNAWGLSFLGRALMTSKLDATKAEARFGYTHGKLSLYGNYVSMIADTTEGRTLPVSEWSLNSTYKINKHWSVSGNWQYDLKTDRTSKTGAGVRYLNECINLGLSVARSYASSTTLVPATTYELSVALQGFSTGGSGKAARRTCRK